MKISTIRRFRLNIVEKVLKTRVCGAMLNSIKFFALGLMIMRFFKKAVPVWLKGLETEANVTMGLYTTVENGCKDAVLRIATSGFYRVFVNGEFISYGPARCAHGFFRVDETVLPLSDGVNHIAIEVVNYYIRSYASIKQEGFVQVEIESDDDVLCASGDGFDTYCLTERVKKIQRYSFQRAFGESYRLKGDVYGWRVAATQPMVTRPSPFCSP